MFCKYCDESLYNSCLEYIKLYLLLDELEEVNDYYLEGSSFDSLGEDLVVRMGVLVNSFNSCWQRIMNNNYTVISDTGIMGDRFNYSYTMGVFAELSDVTDESFRVRVHQDDVDVLDDLLNDLDSLVCDLEGANHNLGKCVTDFVDVLDNMIEGCDDDNVVEVLEGLRRELL